MKKVIPFNVKHKDKIDMLEKAYDAHIADVRNAKINGLNIISICSLLSNEYHDKYNKYLNPREVQELFPELKKFKPLICSKDKVWWSTDPYNTKRLNVLTKLLNIYSYYYPPVIVKIIESNCNIY